MINRIDVPDDSVDKEIIDEVNQIVDLINSLQDSPHLRIVRKLADQALTDMINKGWGRMYPAIQDIRTQLSNDVGNDLFTDVTLALAGRSDE